MPKLIISMLCYCSLVIASTCSARSLTLVIEDNRAPGASLYLAIYAGNTDGSWANEPLIRRMQTLPTDTRLVLEIDLPDGPYAARAYIDNNRNGQLDTSRSGKPREPFAISIGTKRRKPSSRFREAIFLLDEQNSRVNLTLRYPRSATAPEIKPGKEDDPDRQKPEADEQATPAGR